MPSGELTAIVPAYNEELTVELVVEELVRSRVFSSVVVVDDGSKDATAQLAAGAGAAVLSTPKNLGKGGAMRYALRLTPGDVAFFDADLLGFHSAHVQRMAALFDKGYDMVCGLRDRDMARNAAQVAVMPIITGERMMRRWLVDRVPESCWQGYAIETAMNRAARDAGARTALFFMQGVTMRGKMAKGGLLQGLGDYLAMAAEIENTESALDETAGCAC
jgi:glycosyltransferase involved in cell wall biosynthesis